MTGRSPYATERNTTVATLTTQICPGCGDVTARTMQTDGRWMTSAEMVAESEAHLATCEPYAQMRRAQYNALYASVGKANRANV